MLTVTAQGFLLLTGATQYGLLLIAQCASTGPPWLVDFGPDCIVSLDSQITVERLQLSIPDYHELLSNFRKQNCRGEDALCDNETCNYVYSKTAGQVRDAMLLSLGCPWHMREVCAAISVYGTLATLKQAVSDG